MKTFALPTELLLLPALSGVVVLALRAAYQARIARTLRTFTLKFPRDLEHQAVDAFMRSLAGLLPPWWKRAFGLPAIVLEAATEDGRITHRLLVPGHFADFVTSHLRGAVPALRLTEEESARSHPVLLAGELTLNNRRSQLRVSEAQDVSTALLSSLATAGESEVNLLQLVIAPAMHRTGKRSFLRDLLGALTHGQSRPQRVIEPTKGERDKFSEPVFLGAVRLGVSANSKSRAKQLLAGLTSAFHVTNTLEAHFSRRLKPHSLVAKELASRSVPLVHFPLLLNARELAALAAFPIGSPQIPGLSLGTCRQLAPDPAIPSSGRILARSNFPGLERSLAVASTDSLRHLYVLGPTGAGKSTLLLRLILGDIQSGSGVVLVDPKGDLVSDVLARIPKGRERDVILIDLSDMEYPVGWNFLDLAHADAELVTDQIVSTFARLFEEGWGHRTDDLMRAAIRTLLHADGMTLAELPALLLDPGFRQKLLPKVTDVVLLQFWGHYDSMSKGERAQVIAPLMNKLRAILLRQKIRNLIGQSKSTFDLWDVLEDGKILLVSIPKGILGEDSSALVGSLVVGRLWQTIMGRAQVPAEDRKPLYIFLDEFQDFVPSMPASVEGMLAQARAYGAGLILAHQHLGQIPVALRQAVLANCRSKVVFQLSASDAGIMAKEFRPHLTSEDLMGLEAYEAVCSVSVGGHVAPPATGATLRASGVIGRAEEVRSFSRAAYSRDRVEVEAEISARQVPSVGEGPIHRRRPL